MRRLIALATQRVWRKIGAVGFGQNHIKWRSLCNLMEFCCLGKCDRAAQREHKANLKASLGIGPIAREGVHNPWLAPRSIAQDMHRIVLSLTTMDHNRQAKAARKFKLLAKDTLLLCWRCAVPM